MSESVPRDDSYAVALPPLYAGFMGAAIRSLVIPVSDIDAVRESLLAAGAVEREAPRQVAPGVRVVVLADADGNPIGLRGA